MRQYLLRHCRGGKPASAVHTPPLLLPPPPSASFAASSSARLRLRGAIQGSKPASAASLLPLLLPLTPTHPPPSWLSSLTAHPSPPMPRPLLPSAAASDRPPPPLCLLPRPLDYPNPPPASTPCPLPSACFLCLPSYFLCHHPCLLAHSLTYPLSHLPDFLPLASSTQLPARLLHWIAFLLRSPSQLTPHSLPPYPPYFPSWRTTGHCRGAKPSTAHG